MGLRVVLGLSLTKSLVVALGLAALGGLCAILVRPERNPERLWQSIQADSRAQRFDRAYAGMRRLLDLRPPTEDDFLMLARLAMAAGRTNEALGALSRVSDGHPASAQARLWEGQLELRNHRARAAESSLRRALAIDPGLVEARRHLIYLYGMQRRCDELSDQFAALAERDLIAFDQMSVWCLIQTAPWHPEEVLPILTEFVRADPDDRASRLALAEAYGSLGQHEEVEAVLKQLPATDPGARAILARIAFDRGDPEAVESLLERGADDHPILQLYRGRLALLHRDLPAAIRHFRNWTAADPHDRDRLYMLGDALVKSGETVEGERYLQSARDHQALYKLIEQASTEEGRQDLNRLKGLGAAYERTGLLAEAKAWYRLALARDPIDSEVQAALYRLRHSAESSRFKPPFDSAAAASVAAVLSVCVDAIQSVGSDDRPMRKSSLPPLPDSNAPAEHSRPSFGRFVRYWWYEPGLEHGNPVTNRRFRVNAPEVVTHPTFGYRPEAKSSGMLQVRVQEDLRLLQSAELDLALWGGHPGTTNRRVTVNGRTTYALRGIAGDTQCSHMYPSVDIKITDLVDGYNALQFACDQGTSFWGHFIVDEACLRAVLSDDHPDIKAAGLGGFHATVRATPSGSSGEMIELALDVDKDKRDLIEAVDYVGYYEGYDENGDGHSRDWHGFTKKRRPVAILGTATGAPYRATWDLAMLPAQDRMNVRAVVRFKDWPDLVYTTRETGGLRVPERSGVRVELMPASDLPVPFWSRANRTRVCTIALDNDPARIVRAELHVVVWDGGAGTVNNYFTINGRPLPVAGAGKHDVIYSRCEIDPHVLKMGVNRVELRSDTEHHGIEVLMPGPALVVRRHTGP